MNFNYLNDLTFCSKFVGLFLTLFYAQVFRNFIPIILTNLFFSPILFSK